LRGCFPYRKHRKLQATGGLLTPQDIYQLVAPELERVEEELRGYARSPIRPIGEIGSHILNAGGKRIRPALLLLTAKMLGPLSSSAIRLGAVVELIHNATLVHDDIIDAADTRRGRSTANREWGNSMTVLAGDWLYMQSFAVALAEKNLVVLETLIDITQKMVEGELLQLTVLGQSDVKREQLLDIVERKTGALFSGCMKLPAIAAAKDPETAERLATIGRSLGMAFQLVDDLLDLTSTREILGKPVGSDLKEGKMTLPVEFVSRLGTAEDVSKVQTVLKERGFCTVQSQEILALVEKWNGLDGTRALAREYAIRATSLLQEFPPSIYRDAIVSIPEFILNRTA
jgi:octaprenyl-diphosphate synthase